MKLDAAASILTLKLEWLILARIFRSNIMAAILTTAQPRPRERIPAPATRFKRLGKHQATWALGLLLAFFVLLLCFLPLATAVKIGADEDFELSKATLLLRGYHLYSEIWNDQPPLDTFIITQILEHCSPSILGPRLLTVGFAALLLSSIFLLCRRVNGLLIATLATAFVLASPGFLELSCSCMQEIPALAPVVTTLALLVAGRQWKWHALEIGAGFVFAVALQMKLIGVIYLPLAILALWLRSPKITTSGLWSPVHNATPSTKTGRTQGQHWTKGRHWLVPSRQLLLAIFFFGASLAIGFVVLNAVTGNPLGLQFRQAWAAHFAPARLREYGSPSEHPFDALLLLRNWDTTIPALLGVIVLLRQVRGGPLAIIPIAWLALTFIVFPRHKPWWAYYYIHNAIPLCWCAAVGMGFVWKWAKAARNKLTIVLSAVVGLAAVSWMIGRLYLQFTGIREAPRLSSALVLRELGRFKPLTTFLFTDEPIYSFHSRIPMPPRLAMISLKRLWSGDMDNARLAAEMESIKPGVILLINDSRELPFQDLLQSEYRLVYQDAQHRLYAHQSIARKARY